jgi:hypothetical protein
MAGDGVVTAGTGVGGGVPTEAGADVAAGAVVAGIGDGVGSARAVPTPIPRVIAVVSSRPATSRVARRIVVLIA